MTEWEQKMMEEVGALSLERGDEERRNGSLLNGEGKDMGSELMIGEGQGRRCGFVSLLGPSNVGKSTLLNKLVKEKVAIVSPKVQTTRCRILGVVVEGKSQIVLLDTPGVFEGNNRLGKAMVKAAWRAGSDADVGVLVVDIAQYYHQIVNDQGDLYMNPEAKVNNFLVEVCTGMVKRKNWPMMSGGGFILCFNKIDVVAKSQREEVVKRLYDALVEAGLDAAMVRDMCRVSARTGEGVDELKDLLAKRLPVGPWLYPADTITDMPLRLMAAEVTRQYGFYNLDREIPYSLAVETMSWETGRNSVTIHQNIYVTRKSHKLIVTGKGGSMIKRIGSGARRELMKSLKTKVNLYLQVVVKENWKDTKGFYEQYGLDFKA